eukprot:2139545-Heterocapsa_arctica.AAC.1
MEPFMVSYLDAYLDLSKWDRSSLGFALRPPFSMKIRLQRTAQRILLVLKELFSPLRQAY